MSSDGPDRGGFSPTGNIRPQAISDAASQTTLNRTVDNLRMTLTQNQQQIDMLTAQVKEQVTEIQKVNTHLEMRKPAAKVVAEKR
jgi:hypothetical protein